MTILDIIKLDTEIREMQETILELDNSLEPREGALNYAKSDLSYLLNQLSI